jgi:YegS/Rv2252/BmrU family lipid kinase
MQVILNASSGVGADESVRQQLAVLFEKNGLTAELILARSGAEVVQFAEQAARSDSQVVVAGGGDGTINAVASVLAGSEKTLGVLPLGTLNHFAKDLRIPLELEAAVQTISTGHAIRVDVGEVNGRVFVNNSGLGLYPNIVNQREKRQRLGYRKWPAFFLAGLVVLRRYPFLGVRLSTDEHTIVGRTPFVFIGNNVYEMESLNIGGRACLDAGRLSLYMTKRVGRLGLLRLALLALFRRLRGAKEFIGLCSEEIWVETKRKRLRVSTDGEITIMTTPLHFRVRPGALRVLVPKDSEQ